MRGISRRDYNGVLTAENSTSSLSNLPYSLLSMTAIEPLTLPELESRIARLAFYYFQLDTLRQQLRNAIFEGGQPSKIHTMMLLQYGDMKKRCDQSYAELKRLADMLPSMGAPPDANAEARRHEG